MSKQRTFQFAPAKAIRSLVSPIPGQKIDVHSFYITTGDAIAKTRQLRREMLAFILAHPPDIEGFTEDAKRAMNEVSAFIQSLIEVRGDHTHIESTVCGAGIDCRLVDSRIHAKDRKAKALHAKRQLACTHQI